MDLIRQAIYDTLREDNPMKDRQVFYQLVTQGIIAEGRDRIQRHGRTSAC
jgi:hypothetical protein